MLAISKSVCIEKLDVMFGYLARERVDLKICQKKSNRSVYRNSWKCFLYCISNAGMYMITTVDTTAMTQILKDRKVTITHMVFLRKMIHRCVMIQKDLLGDGCYLQHQHVSTLRTICLRIQNY